MVDSLSAAPVTEPVTLAEFKMHRRLTTAAEDAILGIYLRVARGRVEFLSRRSIITQTRLATLDCWPASRDHPKLHGKFAGRLIEMPRSPLVAVDSITYVDSDGATQTFAASNYTVDTKSAPGRIVLNDTASWPALADVPGPISITYQSGYGGTRSTVPEGLRLAVMHLASHYHKYREPITRLKLVEAPNHVAALIDEYRVQR